MYAILIVVLVAAPGAHAQPYRVYRAAQSSTFNLVAWEAQHLVQHAGVLADQLFNPAVSSAAGLEMVREYFQTPRAARDPHRWAAERATERELAAVIRAVGIGSPLGLPVPGSFPPVAFRFTLPPSVLIVSPRDRLEVRQSVLLEPALGAAEVDGIETRVDSLGVSSLVTPIGGIATYPAMVVESAREGDVLASVAHEWVHAYLLFRPLGATYWSSQEGRAINETVADLVGRELGGILAERVGVAPPTEPARTAGDPVYRREMRETRREVERLLTAGEVDAAERYMDLRRDELEQLGYPIRRLNQAFFAFHGSYAESGAGDDRLARLVVAARSNAPSLAAFLERVSGVQSLHELRALEGPAVP